MPTRISPPPHSPPHSQRGFSLLEVIVAFAILIMCVSVIMRIFAGSVSTSAITADYYRATQIAESKMAELKVFSREGEYRDSGAIDGKFRWRIDAEPYLNADRDADFAVVLGDDATTGVTLYQLNVSVVWGELAAREITLDTLALRIRDE